MYWGIVFSLDICQNYKTVNFFNDNQMNDDKTIQSSLTGTKQKRKELLMRYIKENYVEWCI